MYAITRRLDVLSRVLIDCDYSGWGNRREREKGTYYGYNPLLLITPSPGLVRTPLPTTSTTSTV